MRIGHRLLPSASPPLPAPAGRALSIAASALVLAALLVGIAVRARAASALADCAPPATGDWLVAASCELRASYGAPGGVRIATGATLRLTDGAVLGIDFGAAALRIDSGGKLLIDPGSRVDALRLELAGLEANQAVQDLEGTLRLIEDKQTMVRAHVQSVGDPVSNVVVRLRGTRGGAELPGSPLAASPATLASVSPGVLARRTTYAASANFRLPPSWRSGTVTLRVEAPGTALRCAEAAGTDGDCSVTATFLARDVPRVWVVPVDIGTGGTPNLPTGADILAEQDLMEAMYPVPRIVFRRQAVMQPAAVNGQQVLDDLNDLYVGTVGAWAVGYCAAGKTSPFPLPDQVYGAIAAPIPDQATPTSSPFGISDPRWSNGGGGRVAYGTRRRTNGTVRGETMAHEVNHNLDIGTAVPGATPAPGTWGRHVGNPSATPQDPNWGCGAAGADPQWPRSVDDIGNPSAASPLLGLDLTDPAAPQVHPATIPDLMSSCRDGTTPGRWISDYRWQRIEVPPNDADLLPGILDAVCPFLNASEADAAIQPSAFPGLVHVKLRIGREEGGRIVDATVRIGAAPSEARPDGRFAVRLLRADGGTILDHPFDVAFEDPEGNVLDEVRPRLQLPFDPAIATIELVRDGEVVDRFAVSANAPTVEVLAPNGGETWTEGGTVRWSARDPDGDALRFEVSYSPDGIAWQVVALGVEGDSLEVPPGTLPGGTAARVRVMATDGFHTAWDESDADFAVGGNAPTIEIIAPEAGAEFDFWSEIGLRAYANDVEDGPLEGEAVAWSVDGRDGDIAYGDRTTVAASIMGPGVRRLRATATDLGGAASSAVVTVTVRSPVGRLYVPRLDNPGTASFPERPGRWR